MRIGILGFGSLGYLIAKRLIDTNTIPTDIVAVKRPSNEKRILELGIQSSSLENIGDVDVLIVTLKKNQFERAWKSVRLNRPEHTLIISFMAKMLLENLSVITKVPNIVRAMTSTPCVLGKGIGAWIASATIGDKQRKDATTILSSLGSHIEAEIEDEIELATVLSSMNGMIFLLLHAFEQGLNDIGAPKRYQRLVPTLITNAIEYAIHRGDSHLIALADEVTSPNGTTAALRHVLARSGFTAVITESIRAAYEKAKDPGKKS